MRTVNPPMPPGRSDLRTVVITGTSTGIGWGTAKVLIANGFRVFGSVRKTSDAERLTAEFGELFVPLIFDVTDEAAVNAAAARAREALAGERLGPVWSIMPALPWRARCSNCRSRNSAARSRSISSAS